MMLFRIEDVQSEEGRCRRYALSEEELPRMRVSELEGCIANEVRKEINGSSVRKLLSYSKSLGVCLLKYNKYTDNELHLLDGCPNNCIWYLGALRQRIFMIPWQNESRRPMCNGRLLFSFIQFFRQGRSYSLSGHVLWYSKVRCPHQ